VNETWRFITVIMLIVVIGSLLPFAVDAAALELAIAA